MAGLINTGKIDASDNGLGGIYVGKGASFDNRGEVVAQRNGVYGVLVVGDVAALQDDLEQIKQLVGLPALASLHSSLLPLVTAASEELIKPQADKSILSNYFSKMKDFLAGASQGVAGNVIYNALGTLIEHAHNLL